MRIFKECVYGALELLTAGRGVACTVEGESVRFPVRWARYYPSQYEPNTFSFLRSHCPSGGTVLDAGAHIGLFTVLMARSVGRSGRVYSFEPTPFTRSVLQRTVALNGLEDIVRIREEALGGATGTATFYDTADVVSNANSLLRMDQSKRTYAVPTISIDDFVAREKVRIDCLKIDVEGAEYEVLRGGSGALREQRPPMLLALHPHAIRQSGRSLDEVWDLLRSLGMDVFYGTCVVTREWFVSRTQLLDVQVVARAS